MAGASGAARRFAAAAYEIATRDGALDAWASELALATQFAADAGFQRVVDSPAVPFVERRRVVEAALGSRVSRHVLNLVLMLAQQGRVSLLPAVTSEYVRRLQAERGIVTATVTSAVPLQDPEVAALRSRLEAMTGATVDLTTAQDPELIGGLTVRVGDRLIDASVRGRLERLREQLTLGAR